MDDGSFSWTCPKCFFVNSCSTSFCIRCSVFRPYPDYPSTPSTPSNFKRVSWDEYFMNIAKVVSSRSTCPRKSVGAVVVRDKTILSTGYNGSIRGMPHCTEVGHIMENDHCVATIHAESNAILQAARNGVVIDGGTMYVTSSPCWNCFKEIANSGIRRVVYSEFYGDGRIFSVATILHIELVHLEGLEQMDAERHGLDHKTEDSAREPGAGK